ncbi:hypothetical protein NA57DRAFT_56401 [Rhizodiscina lignyota]|uniref:Fungal N-terminal domain-containing protein n=1 Tax=Rhizodiscina lignyota TaxID=1504668 RepID=A0A9P4M619_9PEZI|nr:hypothetical protein NA57DRAFT_56401 [Rhizodiscina lignyota]
MSGLEVLGGVAAAQDLFASCCKAVKYLSKLKRAPQRVEAAVADLEDASRLFARLETEIAGIPAGSGSNVPDLQAQCNKMKDLLDELKSILEPLQTQSNDAFLRKRWREVISVKKEEEISRLFERIHETKTTTHILLTSCTNTTLDMVGANTTAGHQSIEHAVSSVGNSTEAGLTRITAEITSTRDGFNDRVQQHSARLETKLDGTHSLIADTKQEVNQLHDHITDGNIKLVDSLQKFERSSIATFEAGQSSIATKIDNVATLSEQGNSALLLAASDMQAEIVRLRLHLLSKPSYLAEQWEQCAEASPNSGRRKLGLRSRFCNCIPHTQSKYWAKWPFWSSTIRKWKHDTSCPFRTASMHTWEYGIRLCLLPILSRTLEMTFGATSGAGGFSLARPINYYATVSRETSPAFAIFREFYKPFFIEPSSEKKRELKQRFNNLAQDLVRCFETGMASATGKDENGSTLLHELVKVAWFCKADTNADMLSSFQHTVKLLLHAGVDMNAVTPFIFGWPGTALDFAIYYRRMTLVVDPSNAHWIESALIENECIVMEVSRDTHLDRVGHHCSMLRSFLEILECWNLSYLQNACVRNSKSDVKRLLSEGWDAGQTELAHSFSTPLCCALGWPEGTKLLIEAGANGFSALSLAHTTRDIDSFTILLEHDCAMFSRFHPSFFDSIGDQFASCFAAAIANRRHRLRDLAADNLTQADQDNLGLHTEPILDIWALPVYEALMDRSIPVPPALFPGPQATVFHLAKDSVAMARALSSVGFSPSAVDIPLPDGRTVLLRECSLLGSVQFGDWRLISCLVQIGASASFPRPYAPSALFYMGKAWASMWNKEEEYYGATLATAASATGKLQRDGCSCFCSSSGCLPIHKVLKSTDPGYFLVGWSFRRAILTRWCKQCGYDGPEMEVFFEEACRIEMFERLGMKHSCCDLNDQRGILLCPTEGEVAEIQEEDRYYLEQLQLIMMAYSQRRSAFDGTLDEFWDEWWSEVSSILPDLWCNSQLGLFRCGQELDEIMWEELRQIDFSQKLGKVERGFAGHARNKDFTDIIRRALFRSAPDTISKEDVRMARDRVEERT